MKCNGIPASNVSEHRMLGLRFAPSQPTTLLIVKNGIDNRRKLNDTPSYETVCLYVVRLLISHSIRCHSHDSSSLRLFCYYRVRIFDWLPIIVYGRFIFSAHNNGITSCSSASRSRHICWRRWQYVGKSSDRPNQFKHGGRSR